MGTMQSNHPGASAEAQKKFQELVRSFDTAMLVTTRPSASPHARPMQVAEVTEQGDLYFMTLADTPKVSEVAAEHHALVVMQTGHKYLTVSGRAELSRDRRKIEELWRESWKVWAKDKHDPRLMLIRVHADEAEYWDNSGTDGLKFLLKAAAAYISGKELKGTDDPSIHAKVTP